MNSKNTPNYIRNASKRLTEYKRQRLVYESIGVTKIIFTHYQTSHSTPEERLIINYYNHRGTHMMSMRSILYAS